MDIWTEPTTYHVQARRKATKHQVASEWWTLWPENMSLTEVEAKTLVSRMVINDKDGKQFMTAREYRVVAIERTIRVIE